jgi:hypothetical protein
MPSHCPCTGQPRSIRLPPLPRLSTPALSLRRPLHLIAFAFQVIRDKAEAKERELAELAAARRRENAILRLEREFELKRRLDRVDEIKKVIFCLGQVMVLHVAVLAGVLLDCEGCRYGVVGCRLQTCTERRTPAMAGPALPLP